SRLTVLQITAPQPSSYALPMTLAFVPGGPEPTTNGLGSFKPSTIMLRSDMVNLYAAKGVQIPCGFQRAWFAWVADMLTPRLGFDPDPWCSLLPTCQGLFRWKSRRFVGFRVLIIPRIPMNYHSLSPGSAATGVQLLLGWEIGAAAR